MVGALFPAFPTMGAPTSFPATSPEFDLLLAVCSQTPSAETSQARLQTALARSIDWIAFASLAEQHRVVPRVYRRLMMAQTAVPPEALTVLCTQEQANARRALLLTEELVRVITHLEGLGTATLPYKGPVLAHLLYGDVTMREFADLDLLVSSTDIAKAMGALAEIGYSPELDLTEAQRRAYVASGYEYGLRGPYKNLLEVKWRPLPRFYAVDFNVDALWRRAQSVALAGRMLRTFSNEDLLLVLCVHAAKHVWQRLGWSCDIAQLAADPKLDWDVVLREARTLGIERILAVTFLLARELLSAELPVALRINVASDQAAAAIVRRALPIVAQTTEYDVESPTYFRLMAALRERPLDRARFFSRLALTPSLSEWQTVHLPAPLFFLYRVVRLWRLAKRALS